MLNGSIHAVPGCMSTFDNMTKFLGKWEHHIFTELMNSYFQIDGQRTVEVTGHYDFAGTLWLCPGQARV